MMLSGHLCEMLLKGKFSPFLPSDLKGKNALRKNHSENVCLALQDKAPSSLDFKLQS